MGNKNSPNPSSIPSTNQTNYSNSFPMQQQQLYSTGNAAPSLISRIPQTGDSSLPLLSLIVTAFSGSSYDDLFREVPQVAPGGRVSLFSLNLNNIDEFFKELMNGVASQNQDIKSLVTEMQELSPDAVLFNFECCSGCHSNNYQFPQKESTLRLMGYLIERGHMVMCSDFAVKALINNWDDKALGPNPFELMGECSSFLELHFEAKKLEESPSKQLQMVGQLCKDGKTTINALGGTVVFGLNPKETKGDYQIEVLSVVEKCGGFSHNIGSSRNYKLAGHEGSIGHALLRYKTGGLLLLSAGHWIELANLNVNVEHLEKVAMNNYGENNEYMKEINEIKVSNYSESEKCEKVQSMARKFVQQTAACNYSSKQTSKKT